MKTSPSTKVYIVYQHDYNYSKLLGVFTDKSRAEDFKRWHIQNTHNPTYIVEMELE